MPLSRWPTAAWCTPKTNISLHVNKTTPRKYAPLRIKPSDYDTLEKALNQRNVLSAKVLRCVKGGFVVQTANTTGFLPCSLIDARPVTDAHSYVGKTIDVHVVRLAPEAGVLTVNRRSVIEMQIGAERKALMDALRVGGRIEGIVCGIAEFGAFVDIGGIQGLIPIGAWSGKPGAHPSQFVSVGQLVKMTIRNLSKDAKGRMRIGLSKPILSTH